MKQPHNWVKHYKNPNGVEMYLTDQYIHINGRVIYCEDSYLAENLYSNLIKQYEDAKNG